MEPSPVPLDAVIWSEELATRSARRPDRDAERRGIELLARELTGSPRRVLQKLCDVAMELCHAHSAGVSLLEEEGGRRIFRWHAVAGEFASNLWGTLSADHSPCGVVLERKRAQLMVLPERHFTPLAQVSPKIYEALLIPFSVDGTVVGTLWILAHDGSRKFDQEDQRLVSKLASFAALAYERLCSLSADDVLHLARLAKEHALPSETTGKSVQRRVLMVGPAGDDAASLGDLLRGMGHLVHSAHEYGAAIEIARTVRPDIVLVDLDTPDMRGLELAEDLRQCLGSNARIVVISRSGDDKREHVACDQSVIKPLDPDVLKRLLE